MFLLLRFGRVLPISFGEESFGEVIFVESNASFRWDQNIFCQSLLIGFKLCFSVIDRLVNKIFL